MRITILILLAICFVLLQSNIPVNYMVYCEEHLSKAKALQITTGVPVSIQFAQAIYESGGGRSNIAKKAKNHFGMRCGDDWQGARYYSKTGCWRQYDNVSLSYIDHACFLNEHYQNAVGKNWEYWSKLEGYGGAGYWQKIGKIVKRYKLYKYDL